MAKSIISLYHFKFTVIVVMSLFIAFASCSQHAKLAKSDKTQEVKTTKVVLKSKKAKSSKKADRIIIAEKQETPVDMDSKEEAEVVLAEVDKAIEESQKSNSKVQEKETKIVVEDASDLDTSELVKILVLEDLSEIDTTDLGKL
jgi:hypothetical protein